MRVLSTLFLLFLCAAHAAPPPITPVTIPDVFFEEMDDIVIGQENAPVSFIIYSSINCIHCAVFHFTVLQEIRKKYVDPGHLKIVYRHFALDQGAVLAMSLIVKQPNEKWLPLLEVAYEKQKEWLGKPVEKLGEILGLSKSQCTEAIACEHTKDLIIAKRYNAEKDLTIDVTPTFLLTYTLKGVEKEDLIKPGIKPEELDQKIDAVIKAVIEKKDS
jgi:protein-disulfide isomerase